MWGKKKKKKPCAAIVGVTENTWDLKRATVAEYARVGGHST